MLIHVHKFCLFFLLYCVWEPSPLLLEVPSAQVACVRGERRRGERKYKRVLRDRQGQVIVEAQTHSRCRRPSSIPSPAENGTACKVMKRPSDKNNEIMRMARQVTHIEQPQKTQWETNQSTRRFKLRIDHGRSLANTFRLLDPCTELRRAGC